MGAEGVGESFAGILDCPHGTLPCEVNATPLFDESGQPEGALYTLVDQSSRERLRLEAQSTTEWLEAALAGAGIGLLPDYVAQKDPRLHPVLAEEIAHPLSYWAVIRPDAMRNPAVEAVYRALAEAGEDVRGDPMS